MNFDELALARYFQPRKVPPTPSWPTVLSERSVRLDALAATFVRKLLATELGIREGLVRTMLHQPPYRRFDCDRRALVYLRVRCKKDLVRLDLGGRWLAPPRSPLNLGGNRGVLVLRDAADLELAVEILTGMVSATRRDRKNEGLQ